MNKLIAILLASFLTYGCTIKQDSDTNKKRISETLEKNPEILTKILEDNPEIILKALEKNVGKAYTILEEERTKQIAKVREERQQQQIAQRQIQLENALKNPRKPLIKDNYNFKGKKDAEITLIEYSDFQCGYCSRANNTVEALMKKYDGKIKLIYKNLPLESIHPQAMISAQYFEAISIVDREKAWKFHDTLFREQARLREGEKYFNSLVTQLGLDTSKIKELVNSEAVKNKIAEDTKEAAKFGFGGTPGFLINGVTIKGAQPQAAFENVIEKVLKS